MSYEQCPYCDAEIEIENDDNYNESETYQQECSKCGKTFVYTISIDHHCYKADCLNRDNHVMR